MIWEPKPLQRRGTVIISMLAVWLGIVYASDITIRKARMEIVNDMFLVNADASFNFSDDARDALNSGIPIFIDLDIRITRPRKYLWDSKLITAHRKYSIERHALSEQFILTDLITGDRSLHGSLDLAIEALGKIRGLPLAEASEIDQKSSYEVSLRLRLDIESLPAPLIPLAYISPGWHMSSGWYRWKADL
jgi:hypothetical protein